MKVEPARSFLVKGERSLIWLSLCQEAKAILPVVAGA